MEIEKGSFVSLDACDELANTRIEQKIYTIVADHDNICSSDAIKSFISLKSTEKEM